MLGGSERGQRRMVDGLETLETRAARSFAIWEKYAARTHPTECSGVVMRLLGNRYGRHRRFQEWRALAIILRAGARMIATRISER